MINQETDMVANSNQEKSWQQLYWEEQEQQKRKKEAMVKQKTGLILLVIGVILLLAGVAWNAFRGGLFGGAKDVLRADYSGQRAYTYMIFMTDALAYDIDDSNLQYHAVIDQYGYTALIRIHKDDLEKYEDYQDEYNLYTDTVEEIRLEGYAKAYDQVDKKILREYLAGSYELSTRDIDDEILEMYFGKYYLKVDETSGEMAVVSWLLVVAGIVLSIVGGIVCGGKFRKI